MVQIIKGFMMKSLSCPSFIFLIVFAGWGLPLSFSYNHPPVEELPAF
jgi:hypothetical protein